MEVGKKVMAPEQASTRNVKKLLITVLIDFLTVQHGSSYTGLIADEAIEYIVYYQYIKLVFLLI